MNEKMPPRETSPKISKEKVIASLRANAEDFSTLSAFLDMRETEVTSSREALLLIIEIAEIYREAGLIALARQAFQDAATQAWQEYEDDVYLALIGELEKLERMLQV